MTKITITSVEEGKPLPINEGDLCPGCKDLESRLAVAREALKKYDDVDNWAVDNREWNFAEPGWTIAKEALSKIK